MGGGLTECIKLKHAYMFLTFFQAVLCRMYEAFFWSHIHCVLLVHVTNLLSPSMMMKLTGLGTPERLSSAERRMTLT